MSARDSMTERFQGVTTTTRALWDASKTRVNAPFETTTIGSHFRFMRWWARLWMLALGCLGSCSPSSSCGSGFELRDGECVPACTGECGAHERCTVDEAAGTAGCECVAGYVGEPCSWGGGLEDPGFGDNEAWTKSNGATVLPQAVGAADPGIGSFESFASCSAGAVSQIVDMPAHEDAEPFVAQVTYRYKNVPGVELGYGRAFRTLVQRHIGWNLSRFCFGEAAYGERGEGGPVKFQLAAAERLADCFTGPTGSFEVDRFDILVAEENECPAPGEVLNGAANVGDGGWTFDVERSGAGSTTASLERGVGRNGTDGARIYKPAGGERLAGMYTQLSVPIPDQENPYPALRYWWRGSQKWWYYVEVGTYPGLRVAPRPFDTLYGDGSAQTATYCLPPWTHGNVVDLAFTLQGGYFEDEAELVVDDVEIISDPRCGTSTDLLDPSFDSAPNRWPGASVIYEDEPRSSVKVINDPERARPPNGPGVLELRYEANDARIDAATWVWIPPAEANRGPQLVFHSNVPADPGLSVFWVLGIAATPAILECEEEFCPAVSLREELPKGLGWRRNTACLPPLWSERWYRFRVAIRPSEDPLEVFDPPRAVLLDDFDVRLDEACPSSGGP